MVYYAESETVIYAILGSLIGITILFCIIQQNSVWFRNQCHSIGCTCGCNTTIFPEEMLVRQPTSAEQVYAMAEFIQAVHGTRLPDILANMVKVPLPSDFIASPLTPYSE